MKSPAVFVAASAIILIALVMSLSNVSIVNANARIVDSGEVRRGVANKIAKRLSVDIAVPLQRNKRYLHINGHGSNPSFKFYAVVTNTSALPINLWQENCSWGFSNLYFEAKDANGNTHTIKKVKLSWDRNAPARLTLGPGEHRVIPVVLSFPTHPNQDGAWSLHSLSKSKPKQLDIRPVFEIRTDDQSKRFGIWTGKCVGAYRKYEVSYN